MATQAQLAQLLEHLQPAQLLLWQWVRTRMNASMVQEMACLDYGMRVEEYQRGIGDLVATKGLPQELPWASREVLQLASYRGPADPERSPGTAGWRGHVARLFSCLVLLHTADTPTPAATLAGLVESALELGAEPTSHAVRYLAWCRLHETGPCGDDPEARPFLTLGLLLAHLASSTPSDRAVVDVLSRSFVDEVPREEWMTDQQVTAALKATAGAPALRTWRALAARHLPDPEPTEPGSPGHAIRTLRTWLRI